MGIAWNWVISHHHFFVRCREENSTAEFAHFLSSGLKKTATHIRPTTIAKCQQHTQTGFERPALGWNRVRSGPCFGGSPWATLERKYVP